MFQKIHLRSKPELDTLRFISILLVVLHHQFLTDNIFFQWTKNYAWIGVDIFFVLSGYIITSALLVELNQSHTINLKKFWIKRALRLWPHLYFALLITTPVLWYFAKNNPQIMADFKKLYWHYFVHVGNYSHGVFGKLHTLTSHFWSLSVEEHFYFVWPMTLMFLGRSKKLLYCGIAVLFLLPLAFRIFHGINGASFEFIKLSTHTRFDELIFGCFVALIPKPKNTLNVWLDSLAWFACFLFFYVGTSILDDRTTAYPLGAFNFTVLSVASGLLVYLAEFGNVNGLRRILKNNFLSKIGILSYNIYLIHFLVIIVFYGLNEKIFQIKSDLVNSSLVFIISVAISYGMYLMIDLNVHKLRSRLLAEKD